MAIEFQKYIQDEKCLSDLDGLTKDLIHMKDRYRDVLIENSQNGLKTSELQVELKRQLDIQQTLVDAFNNELRQGALKSYKFEPKRKKGAKGKPRKYIDEQIKKNPDVKAKDLLDRNELEGMTLERLNVVVSEAKKELKNTVKK